LSPDKGHEEHPVIIAPVPHLNKSLACFNKNPFYQGFLTVIVTINLQCVSYLLYHIDEPYIDVTFSISSSYL